MSLRINQNISAMSAHRFLSANDANMSKSIERLSSGLRINSAADDAAATDAAGAADDADALACGVAAQLINIADIIATTRTRTTIFFIFFSPFIFFFGFLNQAKFKLFKLICASC
jgi:hypothetical protein